MSDSLRRWRIAGGMVGTIKTDGAEPIIYPMAWPVNQLDPDLAFTIYRDKVPTQGSKTSFKHARTGKVITKESSKGLRSWRNDVANAAIAAYGEGRSLMTGPILMRTVIYRAPTQGLTLKDGSLSAKGKREPVPITRPDLLKQMRGIEDALTGVIYKDDSQISDHSVMGRWGEPARVDIKIWTPRQID